MGGEFEWAADLRVPGSTPLRVWRKTFLFES